MKIGILLLREKNVQSTLLVSRSPSRRHIVIVFPEKRVTSIFFIFLRYILLYQTKPISFLLFALFEKILYSFQTFNLSLVFREAQHFNISVLQYILIIPCLAENNIFIIIKKNKINTNR